MHIWGTGIWRKILVIQDLVGKATKCLGPWQLCEHVYTEVNGRHRTLH